MQAGEPRISPALSHQRAAGSPRQPEASWLLRIPHYSSDA